MFLEQLRLKLQYRSDDQNFVFPIQRKLGQKSCVTLSILQLPREHLECPHLRCPERSDRVEKIVESGFQGTLAIVAVGTEAAMGITELESVYRRGGGRGWDYVHGLNTGAALAKRVSSSSLLSDIHKQKGKHKLYLNGRCIVRGRERAIST